jgi:hypothetical protein
MAINRPNPYSLALAGQNLGNPFANTELLKALADRGAPMPLPSGGRRTPTPAPAPTPTIPDGPGGPAAPTATPAAPPPQRFVDPRNYDAQVDAAEARYNEAAKAGDDALSTGQISQLERRRIDERYRNELGYLAAKKRQLERRDANINAARQRNADRKAKVPTSATSTTTSVGGTQSTQTDKTVKSLEEVSAPPTGRSAQMDELLRRTGTGFLMDLATPRPEYMTLEERMRGLETAQMPRELVSDRVIREAAERRPQQPPIASYPEGFAGTPEMAADQDARLYEEDKMRRYEERRIRQEEEDRLLLERLAQLGVEPSPYLGAPTGTNPPFYANPPEVLGSEYDALVQQYRNMGITEDQILRNPQLRRKFEIDLNAARSRGTPSAGATPTLPVGGPADAFTGVLDAVFGPGAPLGAPLPPELAERAINMAGTESERQAAITRQATGQMSGALQDIAGTVGAMGSRPRVGGTPSGPATRNMAQEPWSPMPRRMVTGELDPQMRQAVFGATPQDALMHMADTGPVMGNVGGQQRGPGAAFINGRAPAPVAGVSQGPAFPLPRRTGYIADEAALREIFGLTPEARARAMGATGGSPPNFR